MRILDFSDGFESASEPTTEGIAASDVVVTPSGNLSSTDAQSALVELQGDINTINGKVGSASGIASLDGSGKVPTAQLPAISIISVAAVADIAARNALTVQEGDVAIVADAGAGVSKTYIYDDNSSTWLELLADGSLAAHQASSSAHAASAITNTPSGNLGSTNVQAALNELQSDIDTRALSSTLSTHTSDTSNPHSVTKTQVGLGNVDNTSDATKNAASVILTNKDIDGGTASNSKRITIPKDTKTNLDGLTRKQGTIVYASDEDVIYYDDGVDLIEVGSGAGGGAAPNYAISSSCGATSNGSGTFTDVTNLSVSLTTTGNPVLLLIVHDGNTTTGHEGAIVADRASGNTAIGLLAFLEGSTRISTQKLEESSSGLTSSDLQIPPSSFKHFYVPAAGTYTYKVQTAVSGSTNSVDTNYVKLVAIEINSAAANVPYSWTGYHDISYNNWYFNTSSYTDPTSQDNNGNAIVEVDNNGFGTVLSLTNGGSAKWPGITFTNPVEGRYRVSCILPAPVGPGSGHFANFRLTDGTTVIADGVTFNVVNASLTLTGIINFSTVTTRTIKVQGASDTASSVISNVGSTQQSMARWAIEKI